MSIKFDVNFVRFLTAIVLIWVPALPASAATLLIVGDSLSDSYNIPPESGWANLLSERLGGRYEVVNASNSGETTAGALQRADNLLERFEPDVLLIILGGNDGLRGRTPRQLEGNLSAIIEAGQRSGARVALMQIRMPPKLGSAYVERFEAVYPRLAERYDIALLPFFLDGIFDQPGMMMRDGIHPTVKAQPRMLEVLWSHLEELLEPRDRRP